jgi:predicted ribosome quality control (RQC) complex YloA/Tae2 family protein
MIKNEENKGAMVPYRHFHFDGWDVYIGKNDVQNDELSLKFAKPQDIWMHVAALAGSHVIIRREKNSGPPPKEILQKTASLAAWFSKARNASMVKVNVTEARCVSKQKNAPPGEVVLRTYKTIRAAPVSPLSLFPDEEKQE